MILFIDDDWKDLIIQIDDLLSNKYVIIGVATEAEALEAMQKNSDIFLILLDLYFNGKEDRHGLNILSELHKRYSNIPVIMLTIEEDPKHQIHNLCIERGAYYYFIKDYLFLKDSSFANIVARIKDQWDKERKLLPDVNIRAFTDLENAKKIINERTWQDMVFTSNSMEQLKNRIIKIAESDSNVLVLGDTGTGKEKIVKAIHDLSKRKEKPFCKINVSKSGVEESDLFGHEKGAFTGANIRRIGFIESADTGTLYISEIGNFDMSIQSKLLDVLQDKEFRRVGGNINIKSDFRLICATNKNLTEMIQEDTFRDDLYYRINVLGVIVPPLRERKEDIPILTAYFTIQKARENDRQIGTIDEKLLIFLSQLDWYGNVRQLEHFIESLIVEYKDFHIEFEKIPKHLIDNLMKMEKKDKDDYYKASLTSEMVGKAKEKIEGKNYKEGKHLTEFDIIKDYVNNNDDPEGKLLLIPLLDGYLEKGKPHGSVKLGIKNSTWEKAEYDLLFKKAYKLTPKKYLEKLYNEGVLTKWKEFRNLSKSSE